MSSTPQDRDETADLIVGEYEADEKQLLLLMKDWRKGRATRNLRQAISDAYVAVFALIMIAAMVINVIINAQKMASTCSSEACSSGRGLLPWAALFGVFALTLAAARMFGPVLASSAEGFWLMEAPIHRGRLLYRRLVSATVIAFAGGAVLGALVAAVTGSPGLQVAAWAAATGLGAAGLVAFAAAEQSAERTGLETALHLVASACAVATMLGVVATATGHASVHIAGSTALQLALLVAALGLVLLVVAGLLARARLDQIRRARLMSGGSLVSGMQGAMFALDFGLMRDILTERDAMRRGSVRPTRGRGLGTKAIIWRDVQRLIRFPKPLVLLAVSLVVPYAVQALGLGSLNVLISSIVLMAALIPFFGSLRVMSRTKGLARCFPMTTSQIRTAVSVVPSVLAALWGLAAIPAFVGAGTDSRQPLVKGVVVSLICALAGLVAAMRWVAAKPANYGGPMISTSAGAMPPGMALNLVRGFDMVAVITLPVVFGLSPWVSLVLGAICFSVLRMGGLDQEELMAQKEENDRMLAEMKAERRGETAPASGAPTKQKVAAAPRPSAQPRATQVRRKPQQKKK